MTISEFILGLRSKKSPTVEETRDAKREKLVRHLFNLDYEDEESGHLLDKFNDESKTKMAVLTWKEKEERYVVDFYQRKTGIHICCLSDKKLFGMNQPWTLYDALVKTLNAKLAEAKLGRVLEAVKKKENEDGKDS